MRFFIFSYLCLFIFLLRLRFVEMPRARTAAIKSVLDCGAATTAAFAGACRASDSGAAGLAITDDLLSVTMLLLTTAAALGLLKEDEEI